MKLLMKPQKKLRVRRTPGMKKGMRLSGTPEIKTKKGLKKRLRFNKRMRLKKRMRLRKEKREA